MSQQFYEVKVKSVEKTTPDCSIVSFDIADNLKELFHFQQGQYITMRSKIDGEEVRRSYSLCSSPIDNSWKVAVKKIESGKFSTYANDILKAGDTLELMPPNGRFTKACEPDLENQYVAFAAGSGITPVFSIIKTILHKEPKSTFKLFYVNRNVGSIILREELEALKNIFMERLEIYHFLTQESRDMSIFNGRLDLEKLKLIFSQLVDANDINDYFVCGPEEMIFMIRDYLIQEHKVSEKKVHFELFNSGKVKANSVSKKKKVSNGPVSNITVVNNGITSTFEMPQDGESILDAALRNNGDLPFACKGGVCCTCRAKVIEGDVVMDVNYALEQEEVEDGYVLTCQSHPTSEKVLVNFDK